MTTAAEMQKGVDQLAAMRGNPELLMAGAEFVHALAKELGRSDPYAAVRMLFNAGFRGQALRL